VTSVNVGFSTPEDREYGPEIDKIWTAGCGFKDVTMHVMDCLSKVSLIVPFLVFSMSGTLTATEAVPEEVLRDLSSSAVFIRADRVYHHNRLPTTGSGFFVHPEGYILTNWHVVADQIQMPIMEVEREINAKVLKLTVVVNSGQPNERELSAKIISRDRTRDLALLQVQYHPSTFIDIDQIEDVNIGHTVWVAGFPFGELLNSDFKPGSPTPQNPAVTISSGIVSSLRRNTEGKLMMVQMDLGLNPGNSGGPVVTTGGRLAGVVFAIIHGGQALSFAISPNRIREFLSRQAIKISFQPKVVLSPPQAIRVKVKPVLLSLATDSGKVIFEGDDIETVTFDLKPTENGMEAEIEFPERIPGRLRPERYTATVILSSTLSRMPIRRRYAIDAVPESLEVLGSRRDPGRMMEDRKIFGNEMALSDFLEDEQGTDKPGQRKRLSDIAGKTDIRKDSDGTVIVDNESVAEIGGLNLDQASFKLIKDRALRRVLAKYNRVRDQIESLERSKRAVVDRLDHNSIANYFEITRTLEKLQLKKRSLASTLAKHKVRWCADERLYIVSRGRKNDPCRSSSLYY